jgi:hypothetical protein
VLQNSETFAQLGFLNLSKTKTDLFIVNLFVRRLSPVRVKDHEQIAANKLPPSFYTIARPISARIFGPFFCCFSAEVQGDESAEGEA